MVAIYEAIPQELKALHQWVCFILVPNEAKGKPDKIPINPITLRGAKANDPNTWGSFAEAVGAIGKTGTAYISRLKDNVSETVRGIGFEFANGYFGVDIDHAEEAIADYKAGGSENIVAEFIHSLCSYAEYSLSGSGIHVLCRGSLPGKDSRRGAVEMYSKGRYFIVTGHIAAEYAEIADGTEAIHPLYEKYVKRGSPPARNPPAAQLVDTSNEVIIQKILNSKQGAKFQDLYNGSWEGLFSSQSEADMSLCNILAFWCGRDADKMEQIFRSSGLYRDKWDRPQAGSTYGRITTDNAINHCVEVYEPGGKRPTAQEDFSPAETSLIEVFSEGKVPGYDKEDFLGSTAPFDFVYAHREDPFRHKTMLMRMSEAAKAAGVTNFKTLYRAYEQSKAKTEEKEMQEQHTDRTTRFRDQPLRLDAGEWVADQRGVRKGFGVFEEVACSHPILPVLRLVNIDTGTEKLKLAFYRGKTWKTVIADKRTVASSTQIVSLADQGIGVTSESAKCLVRYLSDMESLNYGRIPEKASVSRLGWIEGRGFSPYVENLEFDGDQNFKSFFESVGGHGDYERWLELAREVRQGGVHARVLLAASFASTLVKPLGNLPFFVHLWGGTEVGKTVALMLAASVWANPQVGKYVHTFNSTAVGREKSAAFVNSMPLILDELQIIAERRSFDKDIMLLAEGAGRTRGNKSGGVDKTPTWTNCILTSGEDPLTGSNSGGGAINRIVDLECPFPLFPDARRVVDAVRRNYGYAGRAFVEKLMERGSIRQATAAYDRLYAVVRKKDTTEKQAGAVALILAADELATEWLFKDGRSLMPDDLGPFLRSRDEVSVGERAYEYMVGFTIQNRNKLCESSLYQDVWGRIEDNVVYLLSSVFNSACEEAGYNPGTLKSWMRNRNRLVSDNGRMTKKMRVNGIVANCVAFRIEGDFNPEEFEEIPVDERNVVPDPFYTGNNSGNA